MSIESSPSGNVFARLILARLYQEFGDRWKQERDVQRLDRTMASMRLDFPRLVADPELAKLVAALVWQSRAWLLSVAAERGFPTAIGLAHLRAREKRRLRADEKRRKAQEEKDKAK